MMPMGMSRQNCEFAAGLLQHFAEGNLYCNFLSTPAARKLLKLRFRYCIMHRYIPRCQRLLLIGVVIMVRLQNENGFIRIASEVFTVLTGEAATNCFGVKGMAVRSVTDGLVHLLKRESMGKGVHITYNEDSSVSIELHIAVDVGVNIPALCSSIITEVRYKVESATGVSVKNVDVFVDSMIIG